MPAQRLQCSVRTVSTDPTGRCRGRTESRGPPTTVTQRLLRKYLLYVERPQKCTSVIKLRLAPLSILSSLQCISLLSLQRIGQSHPRNWPTSARHDIQRDAAKRHETQCPSGGDPRPRPQSRPDLQGSHDRVGRGEGICRGVCID